MTSSIDTPQDSADPRPEAERQLAAALERHREVLASMQELGRPETSQHVALISEAVARAPDPLRPPAQQSVARLAPAGLDPSAVAQAAASAEATARLQELTQRILADVDAWVAAPADLVDLHERLDSERRSWRDVREL